MEFGLVHKKQEEQSLQKRITELEQQLADAEAIILSLQAERGQNNTSKPSKRGGDVSFSSEEGFRHALQVAPYPLMIWREDGMILMINATFTEISGYTMEDIPTIEDWSHKAFADRFLEQPSLIFYEELPGDDVKKSREFEINTRSGGKRIWDFSYAVLGTDENGRWLMIAMAVDITERREIEEQLQENERKFAIIFDKAPFAAALSRLPDGRVTHINDEFERLLGYTRQEILGKTSLELGINPDAEGRDGILTQIQAQGSARNIEVRLHAKSGDARICLINLDQVIIEGQKYILQTAQDITEQKRIEEAQKELARLLDLDRARLSTILNHLPVGVWISDQEGRLVGKNAKADRIWAGNAPLLETINEYQQYQAWDARTGLPLQAEDYPMALALQTGRSVEPLELNIRRFDGTEGTVLVSAAPIKNDEGRLTGVVAVNVDITDRRQAEQALRDSEERFSKAFHKSPFGMNITRWKDGAILDANDAWLNLLGWTREEVLGKTTADFPFYARPEDRQWVRERITKGEVSGDVEVTLVRKDGIELVVTVASTIIELQGERCILGAINDITERRRAEEALRESEERYRAVIENAVDAIIVTDPSHGGKVISANPAACKMFGYSPEEFKRLDRAAMVDLSDSRLESFLQNRDQQGQGKGELTYIRRDGERFPGELTSAFFKNQYGQQNALAIIRDITDRKVYELALRESEQRYRGLFETMQEGLVAGEVITDQDGEPVDYRYIDVNPATERQYGIPRERFIGRTYTDVLPEGDPAWIQILGKVALTGEPLSTERYSQVSGKWVEAHAYSPRPGQFVNILTDITKRKKAEQALRESEQRFRSLADSMPQLVWTALRDGRVDYYNERHLEYKDIKQVKDQDWDWAPVLHPDDTEPTVDAWLHALESGEIYQIEHRVRMSDGSYRWHLSRGVPMLDENGQIIRWFGTATDIHDLKLAEEQLKIYASRLEKSNRELEQFAFMASHDLQEPLRKIEMFGDLLLDRAASLQENERNYLDRMRSAAGRMRGMIEGLLQISRVATQGKPFVRVDLARVTQEIISDFEDQIKDTGGIVHVDQLPVVTGDLLQLRQLMQNLIGNALKYRQPGKPPEVRIYAERHPGKVHIYVQDKGIGFPQEDADRIFQPFQRLVGRNQYEGSGIGLSICQRIVERHGGEIAAMSEPGLGTTFLITLPLPPSKERRKES
jgi:PAS domain S-box-containing protein